MVSPDEYIKRISKFGVEYVWQATKQSMPMDNVILATKIFNEWKSSKSNLNAEDFFNVKASKYPVLDDNYRMLIISCFYGFITNEGRTYKEKTITPIFEVLQKQPLQINRIVSQQLLKIKFPAIVAKKTLLENDFERHIFPVIFLYQVLKTLKVSGKASLSEHDLYTYVMTANFHDDLEETVELIISSNNSSKNNLLKSYKDRSRFVTALKNINLFKFDSDKNISINSVFEETMDKFLEENLDRILNVNLTDADIYQQFLQNDQGWQIDLINQDNISGIVTTIEADEDYVDEVMSHAIDESETTIIDNSRVEPVITTTNETKSVKRNSKIGAMAIKASNFKCEYDASHNTFTSNKSQKPYMEAHHLIPINQTNKYWDIHSINIDCIQNVVSLCPNCHRAVHHGNFDTKVEILQKLFADRKDQYKELGLDFDFENLLKEYV